MRLKRRCMQDLPWSGRCPARPTSCSSPRAPPATGETWERPPLFFSTTAAQSPAHCSNVCRRKALMGLIDDVDCAVVSIEASLSSPSSALAHLASIPAFAWVTTGRANSQHPHMPLNSCMSRSL